MSSFILKRVFLPMIIGFGMTFLLIFIMFQYFGITEYVWPILFPILGWTFGIMFIVMIIFGIACRVGGGVQSDRVLAGTTYAQPTYPGYPTYDSPSTGSVYVIPVYCPHCMNKLDLDRVEWIGSSDLICPSCQRPVQTGVRENF